MCSLREEFHDDRPTHELALQRPGLLAHRLQPTLKPIRGALLTMDVWYAAGGWPILCIPDDWIWWPAAHSSACSSLVLRCRHEHPACAAIVSKDQKNAAATRHRAVATASDTPQHHKLVDQSESGLQTATRLCASALLATQAVPPGVHAIIRDATPEDGQPLSLATKKV